MTFYPVCPSKIEVELVLHVEESKGKYGKQTRLCQGAADKGRWGSRRLVGVREKRGWPCLGNVQFNNLVKQTKIKMG